MVRGIVSFPFASSGTAQELEPSKRNALVAPLSIAAICHTSGESGFNEPCAPSSIEAEYTADVSGIGNPCPYVLPAVNAACSIMTPCQKSKEAVSVFVLDIAALMSVIVIWDNGFFANKS